MRWEPYMSKHTTSPLSSLDYRRKAGFLRGANISIVRKGAFSYDVRNKQGKTIGRRHLYHTAEKLALNNVPTEHLDKLIPTSAGPIKVSEIMDLATVIQPGTPPCRNS